MEMLELKKQLEAAGAPHVRGIGEILLYLGQQNEQIAELIEQDLANREMSIEACGETLYDYAKKHQKGGSWACAVFGMNPDNPVIKLILDFYKIPSAWVEGVRTECGDAAGDASVEVLPMAHEEEPQAEIIDLMDLL